MKNIVSAIKNILDNINSRLDMGEQKTNKLENSNKNYAKWNVKLKNAQKVNKTSMSYRTIQSELM